MVTEIESDATRLAMLRAVGAQPVIGPLAEFDGLLDKEYVEFGDPAVSSAAPSLVARTSDLTLAGVSDGVAVTIAGAVYTVRLVRPDTVGMSFLVLEGP